VLFNNLRLNHTAKYLQRTVQEMMDGRAEDEHRAKVARTNTETVFRATYQKLPPQAWDTCNVCYDAISPALLQVPVCFHLICRNCKLRCDKCPTCRMTY
jgi:hypothetical protein